MNHLEVIKIWYEDEYGRKWEYESCVRFFRMDAIEILEKHVDSGVQLYYTLPNGEVRILDYYNIEVENVKF